MSPWTSLTEFFERLTQNEARSGNLCEEEMRLAAAALLVHAAVIDGEVASEERRKLKALLQERFALGGRFRDQLGKKIDRRERPHAAQHAEQRTRFRYVIFRQQRHRLQETIR